MLIMIQDFSPPSDRHVLCRSLNPQVSIDSYQGLSAKTISALSDALFRHSLPALETLRLVAYVDPDRLDARPDLGNLRIDTLVTALASGRCDAMKRLSLKSCNVTRLATSSLMHAIMQGRCPLLEVCTSQLTIEIDIKSL